jgi:CDP-paratose 2-epimerase
MKAMNWEYVDKKRDDHMCYMSDLSKMKQRYRGWGITKSLDDIFSAGYSSTISRERDQVAVCQSI